MSEYDYGDKGEWTDKERIQLSRDKADKYYKELCELKYQYLKITAINKGNEYGYKSLDTAIKKECSKNKFVFLWEVLTGKNSLIRFK